MNPNDLWVVCSRRKQLSLPLALADATDFAARWSGAYANVTLVPFLTVRGWCGV